MIFSVLSKRLRATATHIFSCILLFKSYSSLLSFLCSTVYFFATTELVNDKLSIEDARMKEVFIRETIPLWVACVGYITFSIISIIAIPHMFLQLKWYYVLVVYIFAPSLCFCNAYGAGLTDMNMSYNYDKVAPYAIVYRNMAILGVKGFSALPRHCMHLCYGFLAFVERPYAREGADFSLICALGVWLGILAKSDNKKTISIVPAVTLDLFCGDGLWVLPSCILALAKINPPICMNFLPGLSSS